MRGALAGCVAALALGAVTLVPVTVYAQTPQGTAQGMGEAPGGAPLAPMPAQGAGNAQGTPAPGATPDRPANDPASDRSMRFSSGGAECRETVPGGKMLAVAYAIVLVVLGAYVALLARKNAKLSASLDELEAELLRRRPKTAAGSADEDA